MLSCLSWSTHPWRSFTRSFNNTDLHKFKICHLYYKFLDERLHLGSTRENDANHLQCRNPFCREVLPTQLHRSITLYKVMCIKLLTFFLFHSCPRKQPWTMQSHRQVNLEKERVPQTKLNRNCDPKLYDTFRPFFKVEGWPQFQLPGRQRDKGLSDMV